MKSYEQKYKEALEWMQSLYSGLHGATKEEAEKYFPELKETEDERMKKAIIAYINHGQHNGISNKDMIAWLEKQGEKKLTDKVEPKFHEGEWIIHQGTENIYQVVACIDNQYQLKYGDNYTVQKCTDVDRCARLWTIADAKGGDVLVNGSNIFIFHFLNGTRLMGYCHINIDNGRFYDDIGKNECFCLIDAIVNPATKEQRDLLFQKMKEAGYEWDDKKKELKKIEPKKLDADNCKSFF